MINQKRMQAIAALVDTLPDEEQEALYEQLRRRHEERRQQQDDYTRLPASPTSRAEIMAVLSKREERAKREGYYTYDPATQTISDTPVRITFDSEHSA